LHKYYREQLDKPTTVYDTELPSTRYQGSKEKIVSWIWNILENENLDFNIVLDAFAGTGSLSYWAKKYGKQVFFNDILRSNYYVGVAMIENDDVVLNDDDTTFLTSRHELDYSSFIQENFREVYFTNDENAWLDMVIRNIREITDPFKRALAISSLFQACIIKRPYNLFHRANLYMRLANVPRSFGNKTTWDIPFVTHFRNFVAKYNSCVFSNGQSNKALNCDVLDIPTETKYDLVYIDPPYFSKIRGATDYYFYYHFLEGLCIYIEKGHLAWQSSIDYHRKPRPLKHGTTLEMLMSKWTKKNKITNSFDEVFRKFSDSILVVSYNSEGIPSEKEMITLLKRYKRNVKVFRRKYQYALRPTELEELLFIAK